MFNFLKSRRERSGEESLTSEYYFFDVNKATRDGRSKVKGTVERKRLVGTGSKKAATRDSCIQWRFCLVKTICYHLKEGLERYFSY